MRRGLGAALLVAAVVLAAGTVAFFRGVEISGEFLRPRLERALSAAFGLPTRLEGPLTLRTGRTATLAADALVVYQTNPHVDQRERGLRAASILARLVRGQIRPTSALAKPELVCNIRFHNTSIPPMGPLLEQARQLESAPGILACSIAAGYQYADVPAMGPAIVVVTDGTPRRVVGHLAGSNPYLQAVKERARTVSWIVRPDGPGAWVRVVAGSDKSGVRRTGCTRASDSCSHPSRLVP